MTRILDGRSLAERRLGDIREKAAELEQRRRSAPTVIVVASADGNGVAPHVGAKLRAAEAAGVKAVPLLLSRWDDDASAAARMAETLERHPADAVFVQVPLAGHLDSEKIIGAIPPRADIDVMLPSSVQRYMQDPAAAPPLTVAAALLLLDEYGIALAGRRGVVVAEESDYASMFREALRRGGADMDALLQPDARDWSQRLRAADLVVVALARPGAVRSDELGAGCVALDIGYYNEGARGDIDVTPGIAHLNALLPVPGGVGPMTVSVLLERVVEFAQRS